jgi:hypothetical protein
VSVLFLKVQTHLTRSEASETKKEETQHKENIRTKKTNAGWFFIVFCILFFLFSGKLHPYSDRVKTLTNMEKTTTRRNAWKFTEDSAPPVGKCIYILYFIFYFLL